MTLSKDHDKLFADLQALNERQIEVGLAAGVWNDPVRPLVQHYLYDLKLKRVEAAAGELEETRMGARLALEGAGKAKLWATAAFIIAGGAMLAAMAAAFIAFLALRRYGVPAALVTCAHLAANRDWFRRAATATPGESPSATYRPLATEDVGRARGVRGS